MSQHAATHLQHLQHRQPLTRLGLFALGLVLLGLAACGTGQAPRVSSTPTAGVEPYTASDEPPQVRRARIRYELAANYYEQGQTTVALDEIKLSLAADPNYGPAHILRGLVYTRLNDLVLAEESFRRALQINPRDAQAQHAYGLFACEQGRYPQANELFNQALANPTYSGRSRTWLVQGVCQIRAGQLQEAEATLSRAYEFDPSNPIAAYNLASLKHRRGDHQGAQFIIRRINNSELANAESLWLGVKVEHSMGNDVAAAQLGQQLGRRFPQSAQWAAYQRGAFNE